MVKDGNKPIIQIENLGKRYAIGVKRQHYLSLREEIMNAFAFRKRPEWKKNSYFWALKGVSFSVPQGTAVGIIGRNGAGKSTLLKVLSRITPPTEGRVFMRGRVASLLEVGTGFHPELTGRENIFLNGAVLGMTRREISRKFDDIVAFAEVEQFLETPVKRYSSGMYVRLAFAIAAHLEPEILVVDEVLAVGDAQFQRRCLGKMGEVTQGGRTVLFVSHNMGMIASLCKRAVLLGNGEIVYDGSVSQAVSRYYTGDSLSCPFRVNFECQKRGIGDQYASLIEGRIEDMEGVATGEIDIRKPFRVCMVYDLHEVKYAPAPNFHIYNSQGQCVFVTGHPSSQAKRGRYLAQCIIPGNLLNNDTYFIGLALTFMDAGVRVSFFEQNALSVHIIDPIEETLELRSGYSGPIPGVVRPALEWEIQQIS